MSDTSLGQMFFDRARTFADVTAFRVRSKGAANFHDVSYREAARRADAIAAGLLTIPGGLPRRGSVGIIGTTSADWILADFATMSLDAIAVPIYATLLAPEIGYILQDANIEVVVVENKVVLDKLRSIRGGQQEEGAAGVSRRLAGERVPRAVSPHSGGGTDVRHARGVIEDQKVRSRKGGI